MKSTKKIWFFALFLVLILPITACGGQTVAEAEATANAPEIDNIAIQVVDNQAAFRVFVCPYKR